VLQSLLAMPLILCQNGFVRRLIPMAVDTRELDVTPAMVDGIRGVEAVLSPLPARDSPAAFAYHRYEAAASTPTLVAYLALSGAALLACVTVQVLTGRVAAHGSSAAAAGPRPHLSKFPAVDLLMHCAVEDERRRAVYRTSEVEGLGSRGRDGELRWLSGLNVRWSRRRGDDDDMALFDSMYGDSAAARTGEMAPLDRRASFSSRVPSPSPSTAGIGLAISTDRLWTQPKGRAGSSDTPRALC